MTKVAITKSLLDGLANSIAIKSGETLPLTIAAMKDAVDDMTLPSGSVNISSNGSHNVTAYETAVVTVPESTFIVTLSFDNAQLIFVPDKTFAELSAAYQAGKDIIAKSDETFVIGVGIERDTLAASLTFFVSVSWATGPQTAFTDYYYWNSNGYTLNRRTSYSIPQGTKTIVANGTGIDVAEYAAVDVAVPAPTPELQTKTNISPTESSQTITADTGYDGLDSVQVNAIPSSYVGSGVTQRDGDDMTASGATVTAPAGYYASAASKAVAAGTEGTPSASKGTVSNHSVTVTPSVTNTAGYISGGTKTGTGVTVSASELVSGSETKTVNGTYDVTNLAELVVNVASSGANFGTVTTTNNSNQNTSISFTLPSGRTPKAFFVRLTSQIARNSGYKYYHVFDVRWDGSSSGGVAGNTFYMYNGTLTNVTSGYSYSQSGTTFTISSTGSRASSPGSFDDGTYEMVYVY